MKQNSNKMYLNAVVGLVLMLGFRYLPMEMPGITPIGKQIFGIFLGTLYLWTTMDPVIASLLAIFMIGASDYAPMGQVLSGTFGNPMVVQIFFMMILMNSLQTNRISAYIGRFCMTRKIMIGRPWVFTTVMFISSVLISGFVGAFAPIFLFWPILYEVFSDIGMEQYEAYPTLMVILIPVACAIGFTIPPYMSNGLALITNYATISPNFLGKQVIINNGQWLFVSLSYAMISSAAIIALCKFVFRPDVSKLKNLTLEQLNRNPLPPLNMKQKVVATCCATMMVCMLLPSIIPSFPGMAWLSANSYGLVILFTIIACAVQVDGKPAFTIKEGIGNFAWGPFFMMVSAIYIGSVLTNESTGVVVFLNTILSPIFGGMNMVMFSIVLLGIGCLLTNICNSLVIGMLLQPVIATYCAQTGVNSAPLVAIMSIFVLSCAIATPAASPFAAMMFGNKEWLHAKDIYKYNVVIVAMELALVLLIGLPLANAIIH